MRMHKMTYFIFLFTVTFSEHALASYMGNGPGMIATWMIGGIISLLIAGCAADIDYESGDKIESKFSFKKFLKVFFICIFVVFILGLFVAFGGMY